MIVAVQAEHATGSEADGLTDIVTRARFAGHHVSELAADSGYGSEASYAALEKLKTTAFNTEPSARARPASPALDRFTALTTVATTG